MVGKEKKTITVIPGDGIGPDIIKSAISVFDAMELPLEYDYQDAGIMAHEKYGELVPASLISSLKKNKVALKGPLTTPLGEGFKSINVTLRQHFSLFANVRPVRTYPNTKSRYDSIDLVTIRENTEGMYSGEGQFVNEEKGIAEAKSIVTREGAEKILHFAFQFAKNKNRKKVTVVHKANILKSTSGLFLQVAREVAKNYSDIPMEEMIVDNCCMQLVMNPNQFDVIVTTNLFGDILSDLCAGLIGGLGLAPGGNIGKDMAIFEAVHGSAPDIAGKNIANPMSVLLASVMMLEHLGLKQEAECLMKGMTLTLENKEFLTRDLGGEGTTTQFTDSIIRNIQKI